MRFCPILAVALSLAVAPSAYAGAVSFDDRWEHQRFSLFSANDFDHEGATLDVVSEGTVSLTWLALPEADWGARAASWDWSVTEGVPATDLTKKGGDDRDLALYFVFLPETVARELSGAPIRKLLDAAEARVLVYVWGGQSAPGSVLPSPYLGDRGKTVVLNGAGTGQASESVDLAADHERAFGGAPERLVGLAVSADSDDTKSVIRGAVSNLVLN
ncbi:DUF3047 domain-containing protein [Litorisediminicola beolgyonensis]|uniref:DUF3047 domain-containing protein n=1 Tax=Litorisediminicola beolgyonensis TaxID=1173614 RepID=A0ABW3ZE79_9RHOB